MLLVQAGPFTFGDKDPQSPNGSEIVQLGSFYIDRMEVSNRDYRRFCLETGHAIPIPPTDKEIPDLPVANVSFLDAERYAAWAGKRLPSEKEWEKAARGQDGRIYPWGNDSWTNPPTTPQPVFSSPERHSPFGVYNMAGNVSEWTTTHYPIGPLEIADMTRVLRTPRFSHSWRVVKGGYFGPDATALRWWKTYMRCGFPEDISVSNVIGFRCVKDPP